MSSPAAEPNASTEEIAGLVERVTYFNEESGFAVLRVKVRGHRDQATVLGPVPAISAREWLTGRGWWVRDKRFVIQ
jgi:exodeoxyribonuclease V alpha subunit